MTSTARTGPSEQQRVLAARVGTAVFLCSWAMVFISLLFAHALLRSQAEPVSLPVGLASINTGILVVAALFGRWGPPRRAAARAAGAGLCFAAGQVVLWNEMASRDLLPTDSQLAASIYAISGFHLAHVVIGIGGLAWVALRRPSGLSWWRLYWDFVGAAWLAIFTVGFVLS